MSSARCPFEADGRLANERPELEVQQHPQVGFKLYVPSSQREAQHHVLLGVRSGGLPRLER